jgi:hypothetical protein
MAKLWRIQPVGRIKSSALYQKARGKFIDTLVSNEFFGPPAGGSTPLKDYLSNTLFQSGSALGATNSEYSVAGTPLKNVNSTTLV